MSDDNKSVTIEAYQISTLLDLIADQAKDHARQVVELKTQHAIRVQEILSEHEEALRKDQEETPPATVTSLPPVPSETP